MKVSIYIKIYGIVQGVNYRSDASKYARSIGVLGRIRNESDGTVSLWAEGTKEQLQSLLEFCYNGIEHANVDHIETEWGDATGAHSEFKIDY